ncbi:MAG TPA: hypothetical protein VF189_06015 [Patescibacteria group bacterium]
MEKIVHNGIPITIDIPEETFETIAIVVTSPHKTWRFDVDLKHSNAIGELDNLDPKWQHSTPTGETTALAEVGMEQLQNYARRTGANFLYTFRTVDKNMREWYLRGNGRRALGINAGEVVGPVYVEGMRVF